MTRKQPKRVPRPGVDEYGRTPLHYAAGDGDESRVRTLLAAGADASLADDNGWTALHFAAQAHSASITRLLLESGAHVDATDADGNTPLWRAVAVSRGRGEVIVVLRGAGADPHLSNKHGVSPLAFAHNTANFDLRQFFADLLAPPPSN